MYKWCNAADDLNTQVTGSLQKTPYEVVFGQPTRVISLPNAGDSCIIEKDTASLLGIHMYNYQGLKKIWWCFSCICNRVNIALSSSWRWKG